MVLDQFLSYKSALADRSKKAFRAFWAICATEHSGNKLPVSVYRKLFESVVAPVLDYGALFWSYRFQSRKWRKFSSKPIDTFLEWEENIRWLCTIRGFMLDAIEM